MSRRSEFTDEQKIAAVKEALRLGVPEAARATGMAYHNLHSWSKNESFVKSAKGELANERKQIIATSNTTNDVVHNNSNSNDNEDNVLVVIVELRAQLEAVQASAAKQALALKESYETIEKLRRDAVELTEELEEYRSESRDVCTDKDLIEDNRALKVFAMKYLNKM